MSSKFLVYLFSTIIVIWSMDSVTTVTNKTAYNVGITKLFGLNLFFILSPH